MGFICKDITGKRFGRLVAVERIGTRNGHSFWKCKCDCGNEIEVVSHSLVGGKTQSCGCLNLQLVKERLTTHGMKKTKIYNVWQSMKNRCNNPHLKCYRYYGGRGISVCDEWLEFLNFYNWAMANGYSDGLTIDRVDSNGNYEITNCRWITMKEQASNRRDNIWIEYQGERKNIEQWSEKTGIQYQTLRYRLNNGWTIEKALNTPSSRKGV